MHIFCPKTKQLTNFFSLQEVPRRKFGIFECQDCNRRWSSGHAWPGKGQQCLSCLKMIQPTSLEPLRPSYRRKANEPHQQDLCEMCQTLGRNCAEEVEDEDEQSDVQSVMSENSSIASDDADDDDDTPVDSDEEDDEELVKKLALLKTR